MTAGRAIVIGGSLGGLFAAVLLRHHRWEVDIYERVPEQLEGRGAGLVAHPELFDVLTAAGIAVDDSIGVRVQQRITLGADGSRIGERSFPQVLTAWSRLYDLLRGAFDGSRYHSGMELTRIDQDHRQVRASFADGSAREADLLIAADGIRSTVRAQLLPNAQPSYAGYVAWRGMVDEAQFSQRALQELMPYFVFCLPAHEQALAYPVAGRNNDVRPGCRRYNLVWYRPTDETDTLRRMLTDAGGKFWSMGIPPPLIRREFIDQARDAARRLLAPQFVEVVEKIDPLFFQPIYDLVSERLAFGRAVLLGDAAFVARPHCGMGVTKAAGDALCLARELAAGGGVPAALERYQSHRVAFGARIVEHARALGRYMQAQLQTESERQAAERYRSVDAVMRETAVPL